MAGQRRGAVMQPLVHGNAKSSVAVGLVRAATAAMLVLVGSLAPTELTAQTAAANGRIVFVKLDQDGFADIWVMDADGSNETNLTNTPGVHETDPAWSPDGATIAFTRPGPVSDGAGGLGDIWVMDADPSTDDATNLTNTPEFPEYHPAWAPSGTQLVFVREIPGQIISEQPDLFVMDADGSNATNITQSDTSEIDPAWSPDGAKVAFAGVRDGGWEILTMGPDGQNEENLTGDGFDGTDRAPDWSPDGTKLVFMKESQVGGCCEPWEIWAVNRDGSGDTNLTNHPSYDMGPSWSPDGTEIIFSSTRDTNPETPWESDIYTMPAPTTLPPPSVTASAQPSSPAVTRLTSDGSSSAPDWGTNTDEGLDLIQNPSFELDANGDNRPDAWTSSPKFRRSTATMPHDGTYVGRLRATDNAGVTISQTVSNLTAGTSYTFSGWVKIPNQNDATFSFKLQVRWHRANNTIISTSTIKNYTAKTSGWNQATKNLVAPTGTVKAQIRLVASSLNGTIYVDDFRFVLVTQ